MRASRLGIALLLLLLAPAHCRDAEGGSRDPIDREAEDALVQYLRIDTSNPPGNETAGARFLQQLLTRDGIPSQLVGSDPARQSLYARLTSGTNEKALLLLHHIDVVPAVAGEWTKPPFAGLRAGGYIWGRGALDIKSLGIAELMAFVNLRRRGLALERDVIYLAVADEELGGRHGIGELLATRPELFANVGYVLNEGGANETVVDAITQWGIEVQQKVPLWLRLTATGTAGHAAGVPADGGAPAKLVRALANIDRLETPYRLTPSVLRFFRAVGATKKDDRAALLRTIAEPIDTRQVDAVLPSGYRVLLRDTIAITHLQAGRSINAVPEKALAEIDVRLLPESDPAPMLRRIREAAGKDVQVEVLLQGEPVPESTRDTELYRLLERDFRAEHAAPVVPFVTAGTSDSRWFRKQGIVAYGISPFKVNYYDAGTPHGPDERIRARFFSDGVRLMRKIVADFAAKHS
ncbi:MAG TPA: M20/M25/M40 family metallo-hydrolase [Thermoanaerobaculia bacterium]|jgi:acetylornithine deacetylase/succinyl-diaminopimelate desuccinylase-like protein|nr:M20/M25/M40 family metallo-hydrolase [Thermoanaerobaculia bacterium]